MAKKIFLSGFAGILMFAVAAFAGNGAGKAPLYNSNGYDCTQGATETAGPTFGFAVLNLAGNPAGATKTVIATVSVKGGTANSSYQIYVNQDPGGCPTSASGTLTTNGKGNGNGQVKLPWNGTADHFWVSAVGGGQVLRSTSVSLN